MICLILNIPGAPRGVTPMALTFIIASRINAKSDIQNQADLSKNYCISNSINYGIDRPGIRSAHRAIANKKKELM